MRHELLIGTQQLKIMTLRIDHFSRQPNTLKLYKKIKIPFDINRLLMLTIPLTK